MSEETKIIEDKGPEVTHAHEEVATVAKEASKPNTGFFARHFKVTEEFKADKIKAAGTDAEKIAKIEKLEIGALRKGKTALVGAAVVGGIYGLHSIVAGTGTKGPGEKAAEVNRSRENEPSMGRA